MKYIKLFESTDDKLRILNIEDYIIEVLDKYKSNILDYIIGEYLADPNHFDLYSTQHTIKNGEYKLKDEIYENPPPGCFYVYDIKIDLDNNTTDTKFGWEGFCDFDIFTGLIIDLRKSLNRVPSQACAIQVGHGWDRHTITLSIVTKETQK
jgi:hypothetical protein